MKTIHVTYHALLRERRGLSEETLQTQAATPAALYDELHGTHHLQVARQTLKVAINHEMTAWDDVLDDGDNVTFIPPIAGG